MRDEFQTCIRGCTRRCHDEHCLTTGEHDHEPLRRRATKGHLCTRCWEQLEEVMHDLPDLLALWDDGVPIDARANRDGEARHTKAIGSPALINLDVMVMSGWGTSGDGVMPVWLTIYDWVRRAAHLAGIDENTAVEHPMTFLNTWIMALLRSKMAGEFWREMRDLWRALRRVTDAPSPIGRCFGYDPQHPCGRALYLPSPRHDNSRKDIEIRCARCHRTYRGHEIARLRLQHELEEDSA